MYVDIFKCDTKYDLILADPPWQQKKGGLRKCRPSQGRQLDYDTLDISDIKNHIKTTLNCCNDNVILFLWTIDKYLHEAEEMAKELGFKLHARMIWDKQNGIAPSFDIRYSHEYLLYMYKGKMQKVSKEARGRFRSVFSETATKHSKKPIKCYEIIETLYPQLKKIELYARYTRIGWDCWGNEVGED